MREEDRAVLAAHPELAGPAPAFDHLPHDVPGRIGEVGRGRHIHDAPADHLVGGPAVQLLREAAPVQDRAVEIGGDHGLLDFLEQAGVQADLLGRPQLQLGDAVSLGADAGVFERQTREAGELLGQGEIALAERA